MMPGIPNLTGMLFCYATKKEMDEVYKHLEELKISESLEIPGIMVLKAWNQKRPPYPWTIAIICKDTKTLKEVDTLLCRVNVDTGHADTYDGEARIRDFFGMMVFGKFEPGIVRIEAGECPKGAKSPIQCQFCIEGHMTECHYPMDCEQAKCSHYERAVREGW